MVFSVTARVMNAIRATPVTPYVSNPSAVGPTESPALSPVQSAITPGLRGSSSLTLKTIFIRSEPMSAILVKMPPARRDGGAGVGVGIDADAVPGDGVGPGHADNRKEKDDERRPRRFALQADEVVGHRRADQREEHEQELTLLDQVGPA